MAWRLNDIPKISGDDAQDLKSLRNYIVDLNDELSYLFSHLGTDNFCESGLKDLQGSIFGNVRSEIASETGNVKSLFKRTGDQILLAVTDVSGDLNTLSSTLTNDYSTTVATSALISAGITEGIAGITLAVTNENGTVSIKLDGGGTGKEGAIDLTGLVEFNDLKNSGKTEINGDNITTGTIRAIDIYGSTIDGGNIIGSTIIHSAQDSTQTYRDICQQEAGFMSWYRAPLSNIDNRIPMGHLGLVDESPHLYLKMETYVPLKINGANFQYALNACFVVSGNAKTTVWQGQENTILTNTATTSFVPNGEFYLGTPTGSSPSVYAAKSGIIEVSGSYDVIFWGAPGSGSNGYIMFYINGSATNYFTRFSLTSATNQQLQFAPVIIHVNAGDRLGMRMNPGGMGCDIPASVYSNRTNFRYIAYD